MAFPSKTKVPVALNKRSSQNLSCNHDTTANFLQFNVSKAIELVPDQALDVVHKCFTRLDPLPVPTFGRARVVHRAFWVPMRTIFPAWNDFITDTPHYYSVSNTTQIVPHVPYVTNDKLCEVFLHSDFSTAEGGAADFTYCKYDLTNLTSIPPEEEEGTTELLPLLETISRTFTPLGKYAYKLLRSLGINLIWTNANDDRISMLPIYAVAKIYYDYYYPAQYINDDDSSYLNALLTRDVDPTLFPAQVTGLQRIFKILYNMPYSSDYFTSAWDNPAGPSDDHFSDVEISDVTIQGVGPNNNPGSQYAGTVSTETNGTPTIGGVVSQYAINALRALSDYMRRHQIVGSRALDRYLARFGVTLASEKLNRCVLIQEYSQDIQFGDVTSTADTDGANLGDYAGKAVSFGCDGYPVTTGKEYGYYIVITSIMPKIEYYQGIQRQNQHLSRLDFFTPEFDALGTQAIGCKELYCPDSPLQYDYTYQEKVFGFTPRYSEYKVPYNLLTGDLSLPSFRTSSEAWTLFRDMSPLAVVDGDPVLRYGLEHGLNFILSTDKAQYNRIFYVQSDLVDHFKMSHSFEIKSSFPGRALFDDYEFKDEDKSEKVTVQVNGTTAE